MKTSYKEVRFYTPELGVFTVTGAGDDVESAERSFGRAREVSTSTFDKLVYGHASRRRLAFF
jgi:hypothetical protein